MSLNVANDGVKFINVYSQAKTQLGRDLSNFARTPFVHEKYGKFQSIEGCYYYFLTGRMFENLRNLSGSQAKKEGSKLIPKEWRNENTISEDFKDIIRECIQCKFRQNKDILLALISTSLPLEHFYVVGFKIQNKPQHKWILDEINRIRQVTQKWYIKKYGKLPQIELIFL